MNTSPAPSAKPRHVRLGLVQMAMTADPATNMDRAEAGLLDAVRQGAQVLCLPELYRSEYLCQVEDPALFDHAEPVPGPSTERFARFAKQHGVVVVLPLFERRAAGLYHNTAVVIDADGSVAGVYRKMHIPDDPQYYEKFYFTPGDLGFRAIPTKFATLGVLICWDQWYPEGARLTALAGADILFYPTAIGWLEEDRGNVGPHQQDAWRTVQRGHAIANGCFVAAVNRVGWEGPPGSAEGHGGIAFWGTTFLADPQGVVLAQAGEGPETVVTEIDLGRVEEVRRLWPFLRDRRIDAYGGLTKRFLAPPAWEMGRSGTGVVTTGEG